MIWTVHHPVVILLELLKKRLRERVLELMQQRLSLVQMILQLISVLINVDTDALLSASSGKRM
jgi:hypothetical protein